MRLQFYRCYSNLSILLLLFLCSNISVKTAVNSICLGTCSSCFSFRLTHIVCLWKRVQKYNLFSNLTSVLKSFLKINFLRFSSHKLITQPTHLLNLSKNLLPRRDGKCNYFFYFSQIFFLKLSPYF